VAVSNAQPSQNECTSEQTKTVACPAGYTGTATQTCNSDGNWGASNNTQCTLIPPFVCENNTTKSGTCPAGYTGTATQKCTLNAWILDTTQCKLPTECTPGDQNSLACGTTGGKKYTCDSSGKWQASDCPVVQECTPGQMQSSCPGGQIKICSSAGKWTTSSCPASTGNTTTNTNTTQNNNTGTTPLPTDLLPPVEAITCRANTDTFAPSAGEDMSVRCSLYIPNLTGKPLVTAKIFYGSFDPVKDYAKMEMTPQADKEKTIIKKSYLLNTPTTSGSISFSWDGKEFDQPVNPGDYTFVVGARPDLYHEYDYSIFKVAVTAESTKKTVDNTTTIIEQTNPTPTNQQNEQAPAAEQPQQETVAPEAPKLEASQCPGIFYPIDIAGHWAESIIKQAVDACYLTGYPDNTIRPDRPILRAEAVKLLITLVAKPISCYDNDCGTPFIDLDTWMGPWVRPAYDRYISRGFGKYFLPNRPVTRADSAAMIVRAFYPKLQPHKGCYSTNCGAGHPDNLFVDIRDTWSGQYFRALWDSGIMKGTRPFMIDPEKPVTRAEFIKMAIMAKDLK
jgi:hypothetical protein